MKHCVCIILTLCILFLFGCGRANSSTYSDPVYFYYPREEIDIYSQEETLDFEVRDGAEFTNETTLIQAYLAGPERNDLYSPFPTEGEVLDTTISGNRIRITLSAHFNRMIGLQLTVATSCLALTLLNSRDLAVVEINILADDGTVSRSFSLSRDNIVLTDSYVALPEE